MSALDAAVRRLRSAIEDEGVCPRYHRAQMSRLQHEWPVLWTAIEKVLAADGQEA